MSQVVISPEMLEQLTNTSSNIQNQYAGNTVPEYYSVIQNDERRRRKFQQEQEPEYDNDNDNATPYEIDDFVGEQQNMRIINRNSPIDDQVSALGSISLRKNNLSNMEESYNGNFGTDGNELSRKTIFSEREDYSSGREDMKSTDFYGGKRSNDMLFGTLYGSKPENLEFSSIPMRTQIPVSNRTYRQNSISRIHNKIQRNMPLTPEQEQYMMMKQQRKQQLREHQMEMAREQAIYDRQQDEVERERYREWRTSGEFEPNNKMYLDDYSELGDNKDYSYVYGDGNSSVMSNGLAGLFGMNLGQAIFGFDSMQNYGQQQSKENIMGFNPAVLGLSADYDGEYSGKTQYGIDLCGILGDMRQNSSKREQVGYDMMSNIIGCKICNQALPSSRRSNTRISKPKVRKTKKGRNVKTVTTTVTAVKRVKKSSKNRKKSSNKRKN